MSNKNPLSGKRNSGKVIKLKTLYNLLQGESLKYNTGAFTRATNSCYGKEIFMYDLNFLNTEKNGSSLSDEIALDILKKVFSGELIQGTRLIEAQIAKDFDVSNIPVREAFYILQSTGVIERLPRKGVRVKSISEQEMKDYTDALIEIYKLGVDYSKLKWDEENRNTLKKYFEEANNLLEKNEIAEYILKAAQVCRYTFIVAENKAFLRFFSEITYITNVYCQTRWNNSEEIQTYHFFLKKMVKALMDSNFEEAKNEYELLARQSILN